MISIRLAVVAVLILGSSMRFAAAAPDYVAINSAFVKTEIIPSYDRLAKATAAQSAAWEKACSSGDAQTASLKEAYHQVADAWARVFHWNFGPITFLLRRDRFYHWPERRNSISKGLARLLGKPDDEKLKPENFTHSSVAVQGLPAMERLLFEGSNPLENAWRCRVGQAIAANQATMTKGAAEEWEGEISDLIKRGEDHPIYFDGPRETLGTFLTEVLTGYAIIKDQKILPILGASAKKAKPKLIEARRSGRFVRNLTLNLQALFSADAVLAKNLPAPVAKKLSVQRDAIIALAKSLPPFADAVYDKAGRAKYMALASALTAIRKDMAEVYSEHLGIVIGFNSLDGD